MQMWAASASSLAKDVVTLKAPLMGDLHRHRHLTPMPNARKRCFQVKKPMSVKNSREWALFTKSIDNKKAMEWGRHNAKLSLYGANDDSDRCIPPTFGLYQKER